MLLRYRVMPEQRMQQLALLLSLERLADVQVLLACCGRFCVSSELT
jgi:hypothetical protein